MKEIISYQYVLTLHDENTTTKITLRNQTPESVKELAKVIHHLTNCKSISCETDTGLAVFDREYND